MSKQLLFVAAAALLIASGEAKKIYNPKEIAQAMEEFETDFNIIRCHPIDLFKERGLFTPMKTLDEDESSPIWMELRDLVNQYTTSSILEEDIALLEEGGFADATKLWDTIADLNAKFKALEKPVYLQAIATLDEDEYFWDPSWTRLGEIIRELNKTKTVATTLDEEEFYWNPMWTRLGELQRELNKTTILEEDEYAWNPIWTRLGELQRQLNTTKPLTAAFDEDVEPFKFKPATHKKSKKSSRFQTYSKPTLKFAANEEF